VLRAPGRPSLADFDLLGQKLQEDANPDRQEPTLSKVDCMQFVNVARVELLKNRDKPIGGDIVPDYERGQSNKSDTADGKRPQGVAIADLDIAGGRYPHKYAPAHKKSDEDMEYAMQRLFYPLHRLTRTVLPQMLERKRGKIVVVGSADSLRGRSGGVALYGGARAAQHGYMRHVAMEVAPHVNVC
jgi:hypothetical protein